METEVIISSFPECLLDLKRMFCVVCTDNNSVSASFYYSTGEAFCLLLTCCGIQFLLYVGNLEIASLSY